MEGKETKKAKRAGLGGAILTGIAMLLFVSCSKPDSASSSADSSSYSSEPSSSSIDLTDIWVDCVWTHWLSFESYSEMEAFLSTEVFLTEDDVEIIIPDLDFLGEALETEIRLTTLSAEMNDSGHSGKWWFMNVNEVEVTYALKDRGIEFSIPEFDNVYYARKKAARAPFGGTFDLSKLSSSLAYSEDEERFLTATVIYEDVSSWSLYMELRWEEDADQSGAESFLSSAISHMGYIFMPGYCEQ